MRVVGVGDHVQDHQHHEGDGLAEVQGFAGGGEDSAGFAQVGVHVRNRALGCSGEQGAGVREHDGVVIDVNDAGLRGDGLGDLVGVACRRYSGADVQELAYPALGDQVPHSPGEEGAVHPGPADHVRQGRDHLVARVAVGGEVVLAAEQVVIDAGGVRDAGVDLDRRMPFGSYFLGPFCRQHAYLLREWLPQAPEDRCGQPPTQPSSPGQRTDESTMLTEVPLEMHTRHIYPCAMPDTSVM